MKGALAVMTAEIRRHRLVAGTGLLVGCLPLLLSRALDGGLAHAGPQPTRPELGSGSAFFVWTFALVFAIAVGSAMGLTAWAGDLRERRLGFWLSRPVPLVQYWAGKVLAAFLLATLGAILVLLPAHLLGMMGLGATFTALGRNWRVFALPVGLCLATAIAVGGAVQARSRLLALDVVMVPVSWAAMLLVLGVALQAGTGRAVVEFAMPRLLVVVIVVLLLASAAQICLGRLDLPRGHALLSAIGWGGVLVGFVGGLFAFSRHVATGAPDDLRTFEVAAPASGDPVLLSGVSRSWGHAYYPGFLLDGQGRVAGIGGLDAQPAWSSDGRHLVLSMERFGPPAGGPTFLDRFGWGPTLKVFDATGTVRRWPLDEDLRALAVSPDGRRLLMASRQGPRVLAADSGATLARLDGSEPWSQARFVDERTVRALSRRWIAAAPREGEAQTADALWEATVVDWDVASGRLQERGTIALQGARTNSGGLTASADWQRVLRFDATGLYLHDLEGRRVHTLVPAWPARGNRIAGPLSADRYASVEEDEHGLRLRVFAADGAALVDARLDGRFPLRVGAEPRPGLWALGVVSRAEDGVRETLLVDLGSGAVVRRERGLSPALRQWMPENLPHTAPFPAPGSFATRLFVSDEGLVSLDPESGARTVRVARRGGGVGD